MPKGKEGWGNFCCCLESNSIGDVLCDLVGRVLELLFTPAGVSWLPQQAICFWQCVDTGSVFSPHRALLLVLSTHVQD
jgi:hypothetical protein